MASALTPEEPLEDKRTREEQALYRFLKEYLTICNAAGTNDQANLQIVASGAELTKHDFVFVIYTKKRWRNYVADGMSRYVEEKYAEMISHNKLNQCKWFWSEIIVDCLHCYRFYIDSQHTLTRPMEMYQHEVVRI